MKALQRIHDARTIRAKNNIKEMFLSQRKLGPIYTEKGRQMLQDIHPGVYKLYDETEVINR